MLSILLTVALAQEPASRGERLAALRAEVETLRAQVRRERDDVDARVSSLERARSEAEVALASEKLALGRLQADLVRERETLGDGTDPYAVLVPELKAGIGRLRASIEAGLPYRRQERLDALAELEAQIEGATLAPDRAMTRLWQFVEDELALQKENGIDRQVIALDGDEVLVDVVRLGMIALYFRTEDGRMGWADGDTWKRADRREDRAAIEELFTSVERKIRVGWFELPGFPPEGARR